MTVTPGHKVSPKVAQAEEDLDQDLDPEGEIRSAPAEWSAETSETQSPWGPSKPPAPPPVVGVIEWLRVIYRRSFEAKHGRTPSMGAGDRKTWDRYLADNPDRAFQAEIFGEMAQIVDAFTSDQDPALREKGWPLAFLPERIERYRRKRAGPSSRSRSSADDLAKLEALR